MVLAKIVIVQEMMGGVLLRRVKLLRKLTFQVLGVIISHSMASLERVLLGKRNIRSEGFDWPPGSAGGVRDLKDNQVCLLYLLSSKIGHFHAYFLSPLYKN